MGKPETPKHLQEEIIDLYASGLNAFQIQRIKGIHNCTVRNVLLRNGITLRNTRPRNLSLEQRFWERIIKGKAPNDCWQWNGSKYGGGYGQLGYVDNNGARRTAIAHKISYKIHNGEIPDGLLVCHHCDNPECCNPSHLFLGTHKDNTVDKFRKGRNPNINGEKNAMSKLTLDQVKQIRKLHAEGSSCSSLSIGFGISKSQIRRIAKGEAWQNA